MVHAGFERFVFVLFVLRCGVWFYCSFFRVVLCGSDFSVFGANTKPTVGGWGLCFFSPEQDPAFFGLGQGGAGGGGIFLFFWSQARCLRRESFYLMSSDAPESC